MGVDSGLAEDSAVAVADGDALVLGETVGVVSLSDLQPDIVKHAIITITKHIIENFFIIIFPFSACKIRKKLRQT